MIRKPYRIDILTGMFQEVEHIPDNILLFSIYGVLLDRYKKSRVIEFDKQFIEHRMILRLLWKRLSSEIIDLFYGRRLKIAMIFLQSPEYPKPVIASILGMKLKRLYYEKFVVYNRLKQRFIYEFDVLKFLELCNKLWGSKLLIYSYKSLEKLSGIKSGK